jgi:hypothetical protein
VTELVEPRPAGTVHDLGYKRYVGTRRPPSTRWRVIARNQIAVSWKTWWRFKSALGLAVITTFVAGGLLYFAADRLSGFGRDGFRLQLVEAIIPAATEWYCRVGFLTTMLIGAAVVAGDVASGAFTFYFARSVRPRDYVIGKLAGMGFLLAAIMFAGPVLLAALRLGLADSTDELIANLVILPKAIAIGAVGTLVYAAVPLGFSALVANRRYALALWASYYLVIGNMMFALGFVWTDALAAIDLPTAMRSFADGLFDVQFLRGRALDVPMTAALVSMLIHAVAAIAIVFVSVSRAHHRGVGGAS